MKTVLKKIVTKTTKKCINTNRVPNFHNPYTVSCFRLIDINQPDFKVGKGDSARFRWMFFHPSLFLLGTTEVKLWLLKKNHHHTLPLNTTTTTHYHQGWAGGKTAYKVGAGQNLGGRQKMGTVHPYSHLLVPG